MKNLPTVNQLGHHGDNCRCNECRDLGIGSYRHDARAWFIRHGQSEANAGGKTKTHDGIILSDLGQKQAQEVVKNFHGQIPDKIWYSKFLRTKQTAQPTIDYFSDVPYEEFPYTHEFTFLSPQLCVDTNYDDRTEMRNYFWSQGASYRHGEGAETFVEFVQRVDHTINHLLQQKPGHWDLFFSHETFLQCMLLRLRLPQYEINDAYKFYAKELREKSESRIANTQIVKFRIEDNQLIQELSQ